MAEIDKKREEIREGLAKKITEWNRIRWDKTSATQKEYLLEEASFFIQYLHSQGVVIKVDGVLPENPYPEDIFNQDDILKGRVSFVEPLVGDKSAEILI